MPPLQAELRRDLERAVVRARDIGEEGARAALAVLGVEAAAAPAALSSVDRDLRTALRVRGRSLGGGVLALGIDGLVEEIAYEQWHRMLFARFLAENGLLIHPAGAAVSMAEVAELAAEGGERNPWILAARYAAAMLPGIFRADDPAHQVRLAPEHRTRLEAVLAALPAEMFTADDALGWVYQFWQAKRKKEVNDSGRKIGGADLPPVTQLFTEHYMVRFLLENSLGAWWAGQHPRSPLLREFEYLRFRDDGTPAAGTFDGWPQTAAEITVMDPCMGSGHFLVAAADMLRKMRIEEEGLSAATAAAVVLADNLFGLELDPRCTQLAAFALAFDAWKAGSYQPLPVPNIACTGIAIKGQLDDWRRLAGGDANMAAALERLYALFQDAPELGSLIDPTNAAGKGLWRVDSDKLLAKLEQALARETDDPAAAVFGAAAEGTAKAARLLTRRYWLVATNPPFLGVAFHEPLLKGFLERNHPEARKDLGTSMFESCERLADDSGTVALVVQQSWLLLTSYRRLRERLLSEREWLLLSELGTQAFESIDSGVVSVGLAILGMAGVTTVGSYVAADRVGDARSKREQLLHEPLIEMDRLRQLRNPDARIVPRTLSDLPRLAQYADGIHGLGTKDSPRFVRTFWEVRLSPDWEFMQASTGQTSPWGGMEHVVYWQQGKGLLHERARRGEAILAGASAHGRPGVLVSQVGYLATTLYWGGLFEKSAAVVAPTDRRLTPAIWAYCSSPAYATDVREIDRKLAVTNTTLVKVPFDLEHWQKVAAEQYPNGLPEPHSNDPTQWLFKGTIPGSTAPLQVAVARLLGYRWPDQAPDALDELADGDGIVPLPSVLGEVPAHERLRALLARAYGADWSPALLDRLLAEAGTPGATLESWLRDGFFIQHTRLFANRPFIWQVWDGEKDGFSVLLNYHRHDARALEKLTFSYLNDWIDRQKARREEPAAEARLVAALGLQRKLRQILDGEPPYDIYVRWKPLERQPIGWEPDIDDGVRINIRPFVAAGILRAKFTINWNKDRGTNPDDGSERLNDLHFKRAQKAATREGDEVTPPSSTRLSMPVF